MKNKWLNTASYVAYDKRQKAIDNFNQTRGVLMKYLNLSFVFKVISILFIFVWGLTTQLANASENSDPLPVQTSINNKVANINAQDKDGTTPLMYAIKEGKTEATIRIIESGADIKDKDKSGYDALLYAVSYAVEDGRLEIIKSLIDKGADLESKDLSGTTPLILAANNSPSPYATDVIKLLIKSGANINAKNLEGETALDLALLSKQGNVIDVLLKAGNINLWAPAVGKARLIFVCSDLYDYIKVTDGKQSKRLNEHWSSKKGAGVAFLDVDPGKHTIDANYDKYVSPKLTTINVMAGQTCYFKVTQNMKNRIWGYAMLVPSSLVDKATGNNPFPITLLTESEAKQKIIEILQSKELK